jgi:hypothetical protein
MYTVCIIVLNTGVYTGSIIGMDTGVCIACSGFDIGVYTSSIFGIDIGVFWYGVYLSSLVYHGGGFTNITLLENNIIVNVKLQYKDSVKFK